MQTARVHPPPEQWLSSSSSSITYYSLKNQLVALLFAAIETEKDDTNLQMLLHGQYNSALVKWWHVVIFDMIKQCHVYPVCIHVHVRAGQIFKNIFTEVYMYIII